MILSLITADVLNICHATGMTFIGLTPVLPFLIEVGTCKKKKHRRRIYLFLGLVNSGILLSYYFNDNVCLLSQCENYFNPKKYESYKVDKSTINNLYASCLCIGIQTIFNKFEFRFAAVGSYYVYLFYNFYIKKFF